MSIATSLQKLSSDISNAYSTIGTMGGTIPSDKNTNNLSTAISSIPQGGGTPTAVEEKFVNFYDYDGTLLYSYTKAEYDNLTALPDLPSHTGLEADTWSYTKANLDTRVAWLNSRNALDCQVSVGAMYKNTTSQYTNVIKIHITIGEEKRTPYINVASVSSSSGGPAVINVDWGDNTTGTLTEVGTGTRYNGYHTYSSSGDYVITLESNYKITISSKYSTSDGYSLIGDGVNYAEGSSSTVYRNGVSMIELYCRDTASLLTLGDNALGELQCLEKCIIDRNVIFNGTSIFKNDKSLKALIFEVGYSKNFSSCYGCSSLELVIFANHEINSYSVRDLSAQAFYECNSLKNIEILGGRYFASSGSQFYRCYSLKKFASDIYVNYSTSSSSSKSYIFYQCYSLKRVVLRTGYGGYIISGQYNQNNFAECNSLTQIELDGFGTATLGASSLRDCPSLSKIIMSNYNSNLKIPSDLWARCYNMKILDCRGLGAIPTLSSTASNTFEGWPSDYQIIVPDDLYETWIATTGWVDIASHIIKSSNYTE